MSRVRGEPARRVQRVRDRVAGLDEHRAAARAAPYDRETLLRGDVFVHFVRNRLEPADHHGRGRPLPEPDSGRALPRGHLTGPLHVDIHLFLRPAGLVHDDFRREPMPAVVPLAGECRRCETAGRLRRRGRRRNCDRRGRNSRCGGRRCTPARVMRRHGGGRSEARGCRSRGVPTASRQRAAQRGQYRFRIRAGNGYMLIACDAFKIGDGIRIIGRRIALCYITLHYIEKRRIQTAQIPVDRGIVTFNEKSPSTRQPTTWPLSGAHATVTPTSLPPGRLHSPRLSIFTRYTLHAESVRVVVSNPDTRSLALLDSPPAGPRYRPPLAGCRAKRDWGGSRHRRVTGEREYPRRPDRWSERWSPAPRYQPRPPCRCAAASSKPRWRSSMAADRMAAVGLALFWPAMSGAEPWIGSNMDGYSSEALMQPEAE